MSSTPDVPRGGRELTTPSAVLVVSTLAVTIVVMVTANACGRTSPDPCRARESIACDTLAEERALEEADYDAAVAALDGDLAAAEGACVQAFVSEQLERRCIADACVELCTLHPCALQDPEQTCADGCNQLVADNAIPDAALDAAVVRAAGDPGLCTCAVCDDATQALCDALWVCVAP